MQIVLSSFSCLSVDLMVLQTVSSLFNVDPWPVPVEHHMVLLIDIAATKDLESNSCSSIAGKTSVMHSID